MERITNIKAFMKNPVQFLDQHFVAEIKRVPMGHKNFYLVYGPEMAHEILVQRNGEFIQNRMVFDRIKPVTGKRGLVQLEGEESRVERRKVRPSFSPTNLISMGEKIEPIVAKALARTNENEAFEVSPFMSDLILTTAFKLFLDVDLEEGSKEIARDFLELNRICGEKMRQLISMPDPRIPFLRRSIRKKVRSLLPPHSTELQIDQCMTFLFAGHETTASSLAFTLLLLAKHPEFQERIAAGDEELMELVYKESLRLFPPAYMLARQASRDSKLGSFQLKKGDPVIIALKQIQERGDCFEKPLAFLPERFLEKKSNMRAFMPFGLGPKSCIGESLAYFEAAIVIKAFCRKFKFKTDVESIRSIPHITLHPEEGQCLQLKFR